MVKQLRAQTYKNESLGSDPFVWVIDTGLFLLAKAVTWSVESAFQGLEKSVRRLVEGALNRLPKPQPKKQR